MKIHVSEHNEKMGKIPSISFPPKISCTAQAVHDCGKYCYAAKAYRRFETVRKAYDDNYNYYLTSPNLFFADLAEWIFVHKPKKFRYCVSGDAPNSEFFEYIHYTATAFENTKFLMYTKNYADLADFLNKIPISDIPENLTIRVSYGLTCVPDQNFELPKAYIDFADIGHNCPCQIEGVTCSICSKCFTKQDIIFPFH